MAVAGEEAADVEGAPVSAEPADAADGAADGPPWHAASERFPTQTELDRLDSLLTVRSPDHL